MGHLLNSVVDGIVESGRTWIVHWTMPTDEAGDIGEHVETFGS